MATFEAQVEGLTSLSIDGSSAPTQTELTTFLTDGAKELINSFGNNYDLLAQCAAKQSTFTSAAVESEAEALNTGKVLTVYMTDSGATYPCRKINPNQKYYYSDSSAFASSQMEKATVTDPVYYVQNNFLNAIPASKTVGYSEVQYPAVAYGDSAVSSFPDEAEYLVPIYASIKSLQNAMAAKAGNSDVTTALTAINAEIDECLTIADSASTEIGLANAEVDKATAEVTLSNAEVDKMAAEVALSNAELDEALVLVDSGVDTATAAIATALGRINTAVALANTEFDLVNAEVDLANTQVDAEDIELAQGYIQTAQGFSASGGNYINEAQASLSEAQGYVSEVSARVSQVQAQVGVAQGFIGTSNAYGSIAQGFLGTASGYANSAQGYIATSSAYLSQIQSKLAIAQAYSNEVQSRLSVITAEYSWMEKQQAKLQSDYDKGVQILKGTPS
jgi:hypothetical protein